MAVVNEDYLHQNALVLMPTDELLNASVVQEIHACIDSTTAKHIIVDFRTIRFLSSGSFLPDASPITPLMKLHQLLSHEARRLVLCNLSSEVADVFRITQFDRLFEIQPDLDTALSSVSGKRE